MFLKIMVWIILISQIGDLINNLNDNKIESKKKFIRSIICGAYIYACILIVQRLGI